MFAKGTILVIEDTKNWQEILSDDLKENGYEPFICSNFNDAKERLDANSFDLLIIDIVLNPEDSVNQSGLDLIEIARSKDIPFIIITGHALLDIVNLARGIDSMPIPILKKEYDTTEFIDEVEKLIEKSLVRLVPDIFHDKNNSPLPYCIKQFKIENFQCIQEAGFLEIPVNCPWIFVTGENGDGKTSLLQAIAIGLYGVEEAEHLLGSNKCRIGIEIKEDGFSRKTTFRWERNYWKAPYRAERLIAYGPYRLEMQGDQSINDERTINPIRSLLKQKGNLRNIERWLNDCLKNGDENESKRANSVSDLLLMLMPNVTDIRLNGKVFEYCEKGHWVPAHHLSSGHKSILAMIGDMIIKLFESQPDVKYPWDLNGIVIIDEFETHLHPKWQVRFPQILCETFPLVQFIVSTHSIIPFIGAPDGAIFLKVTRDREEGTKVRQIDIDVANLLPNILLTSPLFNLDIIVNRQNKDFSEVRTEDNFEEMRKNELLDAFLEKMAKEDDSIPEYLR